MSISTVIRAHQYSKETEVANSTTKLRINLPYLLTFSCVHAQYHNNKYLTFLYRILILDLQVGRSKIVVPVPVL